MLAPASTLNSAILALTPSANKDEAITAFVAVIAEYMNKVQGGSSGTVGILTVNQMAMYNVFVTQVPVADSSWISKFADAWYQGVAQGTITPGTVTNGAWVTSGTDVSTSLDPVTTITTLTSAKAMLESELTSATFNNNPALPFAEAVRDATLAFTFACIGLGPLGVPITIDIPAE